MKNSGYANSLYVVFAHKIMVIFPHRFNLCMIIVFCRILLLIFHGKFLFTLYLEFYFRNLLGRVLTISLLAAIWSVLLLDQAGMF